MDEVLGLDRNRLPNEKENISVRFTDPSVCKHLLVAAFCPYQQLGSTRSDLGPCPFRLHEDHHREQFQAALHENTSHLRQRDNWEADLISLLQRLVNDLERRMRRGRDRIEVNPEKHIRELTGAPVVRDVFEEKRALLDLQAAELVAQMEKHGEEGRIQEAQALVPEMERLKAEIDKLRAEETAAVSSMSAAAGSNDTVRIDKRMEVCETCGALILIGDAQKRIEAHFEGRQHNGWARIRQTLIDLREARRLRISRTANDPKRDQLRPNEVFKDEYSKREEFKPPEFKRESSRYDDYEKRVEYKKNDYRRDDYKRDDYRRDDYKRDDQKRDEYRRDDYKRIDHKRDDYKPNQYEYSSNDSRYSKQSSEDRKRSSSRDYDAKNYENRLNPNSTVSRDRQNSSRSNQEYSGNGPDSAMTTKIDEEQEEGEIF